MRNRYLLCLLLCGAMIYWALPQLSPSAPGIEGAFAIAWITFAVIVLAGNFSALLFLPSKETNKKQLTTNQKRRIHSRS